MGTCDGTTWWRGVLLVTGALSTTVGHEAYAQQSDAAAARPLFEEGRRLMKAGHYTEACPKLEAARQLYAGSGVLLNLGDCHEHTNRTASAWREFGEAAAAAAALGRHQEEVEANRRKALIEPRLSRVQVHVTTDVPGLVITLDGKPVDHTTLSAAFPIDAGTHQWSASASGYVSWSSTSETVQPGTTLVLEVPDLKPVPPEPPPAQTANAPGPDGKLPSTPLQVEPSSGLGTQKVLSLVAGGLGVVGLGVGGALGLMAKAQDNTAAGETGPAHHTDSVSAVSKANVATGVFIAGGALAATGVVLWLTAPGAKAAVGFNGSGITIAGSF
jgi:hypothetical protein